MLQGADPVDAVGGNEKVFVRGQKTRACLYRRAGAQRHTRAVGNQIIDGQSNPLFFLPRHAFARQIPDVFALLAQPYFAVAALYQPGLVKIAQAGAYRLNRHGKFGRKFGR